MGDILPCYAAGCCIRACFRVRLFISPQSHSQTRLAIPQQMNHL
jgi:hypothetical protein